MREQPTSTPVSYFTPETRNLFLKLVITALTAFGVSWWTMQVSQNDMRHRLDTLDEKTETNAKRVSENASLLQQNAIRLAEVGIIQNNTLEQIRDVKQEQERIKNQIGRR